MTDDMGGTYFHKGLCEWWSEESTYLFQRIERWAALSRGYNRLRSIRLSRARMTMQIDKTNNDLYWCNSSSSNESGKINCCGTFNYQSNGNFNGDCFDDYRYDHSIYFKTIGDIKYNKRKLNNNNNTNQCENNEINDDNSEYYSCCNNNYDIELNVHMDNNDIESLNKIDDNTDKYIDSNINFDYLYNNSTIEMGNMNNDIIFNNVWPIVDNSMMNEHISHHCNNKKQQRQFNNDQNNNNYQVQGLISSSSNVKQSEISS